MKLTERQWPQLRRKLAAWYAKAKRDLPWRRTTDPYAITVSEVMLQQTQVVTVIPYYERWLKTFPTWKALATAKEHDVIKAWEGLGYYRRAQPASAGEGGRGFGWKNAAERRGAACFAGDRTLHRRRRG